MKPLEKDIAKNNNVSHNKVNCIIHELSRKTILPGPLPTIMNFDEFKATKDTEGKMAFIIINNKTGKTFDILPSRKSNYLRKYFFRFPRKQRLKVKYIIIDLFGPYYNLFKQIFPNATIISDRFHIVTQANNALKCTRVQIMKQDKKNYNKFKIYIINSLKYNFNNGIIEGTNNLIKCIKRIAFGYKSFYHFKTRILLITGIYKIA